MLFPSKKIGIIWSYEFFVFCDAPEFWQMNLQDPATPISEGMIYFHNFLFSFLAVIGILVLWMLWKVVFTFDEKVSKSYSLKFTHSSLLEIIWTILPAVALLIIAIPSFALLYSLDEIINDPAITLKVIGSQWYWSYEYSDQVSELLETGPDINYDSYMLSTDDLVVGSFRILEVDNRVVLPIHTHIRLLVTATDVLHSWAIPSFGIKIDACPGRLSQSFLFLKREGVFYGQCSEICGVNHGFMPIAIRGVDKYSFLEWYTPRAFDD